MVHTKVRTESMEYQFRIMGGGRGTSSQTEKRKGVQWKTDKNQEPDQGKASLNEINHMYLGVLTLKGETHI